MASPHSKDSATMRIDQLPLVGSSFAFEAGAFVKVCQHMASPCIYRLLVWMAGHVFSAAHGPIKVDGVDRWLVVVSVHFLQSSGM